MNTNGHESEMPEDSTGRPFRRSLFSRHHSIQQKTTYVDMRIMRTWSENGRFCWAFRVGMSA